MAGQISGMVNEIRPARKIIEDIMNGAKITINSIKEN
jgi:NAD(P)H-dependent flavin oxidoreductase YrpB (nitropropane dioxygenase family)